MRRLVLAALSIAILGCAPAGSALGREEASVLPATLELLPQELEIVRLVNEYRVANGLTVLSVSPQLSRAARKHAAAMAGRGEMAHILDGKGPGARVQEEGFTRSVGENVGAGTPGAPADFFGLWVDSAEHRANILRAEWGEIGVGFARAEQQGEDYWVALFGASP